MKFKQKKYFQKKIKNVKWVTHDFLKIWEKWVFRPFDIPRVVGVEIWYLHIYIAYTIAVISYIYNTCATLVCAKFAEAPNMHIFL